MKEQIPRNTKPSKTILQRDRKYEQMNNYKEIASVIKNPPARTNPRPDAFMGGF